MNLISRKFNRDYFKNYIGSDNSKSVRNKRRIKEILKYKKNGKLLEIGCAKGDFIKLAGNYFNVEGLDISSYAVNYARKFTGKNISKLNVEKGKLRNNYYDTVVAFNIFEHLKNPQRVIGKVYKSLKKGGFLIGSVPNNFGFIGGVSTIIANFFDRTHKFTPSPGIWFKIFKNEGFKKILFFGEVTITRNNSFYITPLFWKYFSFNLIFICIK